MIISDYGYSDDEGSFWLDEVEIEQIHRVLEQKKRMDLFECLSSTMVSLKTLHDFAMETDNSVLKERVLFETRKLARNVKNIIEQ